MQSNNVSTGVGIAFGVALYVGFIAAIMALAVRWSRSILARKSEALASNLVANGARHVATAPRGGLYAGRESEYEVAGRRVFVDARYVSRDFVRANLRLPGGPFPRVTLYPEGALQRLGKALTLNREVQLGDEVFDRAVYIDTTEKDDERVRALLQPASVRDAVRQLLALGFKVHFSARGVEAYKIVYALRSLGEVPSAQVAALLFTAADTAPRFDGAALTPEPDPASRGLWLAVGASVAVGLGAAVGVGVAAPGHMLDGGDVARAFLYGAGLWVVVIAGVVAVVRGRSSAMSTLLGAGLVGLFVLPLLGGGGLLLANRLLDHGAVAAHPTVIQRMHRKERDLHVASWREGRAEEVVYCTYRVWSGLSVGDRVEVRVHPGLFGWAWTDLVTGPLP